MNCFVSVSLAEEISRNPDVDSIMWLLLIFLMQVYNEKEQAEQEKIQNVQLKEKRSTSKHNETETRTEGDKTLKE